MNAEVVELDLETADRGDEHAPTTDDDAKEVAAPEQEQEEAKAEEAKAEEEQPRDDKGKFAKRPREDNRLIPRDRFNEAVSRERDAREAAERKLAEIEARQKMVDRNVDVGKIEETIGKWEAYHAKMLLDGEAEKAADAMRNIRLLERQIAINTTQSMSAQDKDMAREEIRMELTVEKLQAQYPMLDENSDEFDQDLVDDITDKQAGYVRRDRMSPAKALAKAAAYVMERREARDAGAPQRTGLNAAKDTLTTRKAEAVARNTAAAARQPASMRDSGADSDKFGKNSDKVDVSKLTYDEFTKLPESTMARLRGDIA